VKIVIIQGNVAGKLRVEMDHLSVETLPQIINDKAERSSKTILVFDGFLFANPEEDEL